MRAVDSYAQSVEAQLSKRASGGLPLDLLKLVLTVTSLLVTIPLGLAMSISSNTNGFPPIRWPWRTLADLAPDVDALRTALAQEQVGLPEPSPAIAVLYDFLDELDSQRRPTHVTLGKLAGTLRSLHADR